ncbi:MAG: hypothetical protein HFE63_06035 [Clostridiales bacterium]|nr:hypothetical protein [Clostridiales bacterium]
MEKDIYKHIRAGEAYVADRVKADTERSRKGLFELVITKDGKPIDGDVCVEATMTDIDFNFGANIFMLNQYDTDEKNRLYEREFTKIFNSAAIPLYWEGTEPTKGNIRYSREAPNDVYRRPPADIVADFCEANNIRMKGHPLFWHEFVPKWVTEYDFSELKYFIEKRFAEISERYADRCERFDVVNEPSRIYDVYMRDRASGGRYIIPEDDYCVWAFELARRYFPANKLILNDTVEAAFHDFRGKYSGYYLNIKDLLSRGVQIDEIGMQCHLGDRGGVNVYNGERLYNVLDTYASFGKPINISEISIPSKIQGEEDEELQAIAAEQLYRICFSHPALSGITWWNLPDDGVLTTKRKAGDENLPSTGLIDGDYNEKLAYKTLDRLINTEWRTDEVINTSNGIASFKGFYGKYDIKVTVGGEVVTKRLHLSKDMSRVRRIEL